MLCTAGKKTISNGIYSCLLLFALLFNLLQIAAAQDSLVLNQLKAKEKEAVKPLTQADLIKAHEELEKELSEARNLLKRAGDREDGVKQIQDRVERLQDLELILEQQNTALSRKENLESELSTISKTNPLKNFSNEKTGSFLLLENLRGQLSVKKLKVEQVKRSVVRKQTALETSQSTLEELQQKRRRLKESYGSEPTHSEQKELELISLDIRKADGEVVLRRMQVRSSKLEKAVAEARLKLLEKQISQLSHIARFDEEVLKKTLKDISDRESQAKKAKSLARTSLQNVNRQLLKVKKNLSSGEQNDNSKAAVEILAKIRESIEIRIEILDRFLYLLVQEKHLWHQRADFHLGRVDKSKRKTLRDQSEDLREVLVEELKFDELKLAQFRKELSSVESQLNELSDLQPDIVPRLNEYRQGILKTREIYEQQIDEAERLKRLHESLEAELSEGLEDIDVGEQVDNLWTGVVAIWNFELTTIEDRAITVKKIFFVLVLFFFGYVLSRFLSRQLRRKLLPRLRVEEGSAAALESLTFYILVFVFTLFALKLVHIPLTIFTLLGGAIAIGVGFGSQNLINNFMSGLIILLERPIRVSDLIEVDSLTGKVERIGLRSTMIRTGDNIDVLVPNSSFLQKNVVNWTLGDDRVRLRVTVGVIYGSPTNKVRELLLKAVGEHKKILSHPAPLVWFMGFGDNALIFDVLFWARVKSTTEKFTLQSDIRYAIDDLFREAKLVIAFPQRDVHLDLPIQVEVVSREKTPTSKDQST